MTALQPFDRHPAAGGALEASAGRMTTQASRAIDAEQVTMHAFAPAVQNWDGIAAPELRAAPEPVRQQAYDISGSLSWAATALRYWASQVAAFNSRVEQIRANLSAAKTEIFSATGADGKPLPMGTMLDAAEAVDAVARKDWQVAYTFYVISGERTATGMFRDGPTPANVAAASAIGLLPAGAGWNPLHPMWQAFKGMAVPPGDYGPLGPYPWYGGRIAFAGGLGLDFYRNFKEQRWANSRPWRIGGTGPYAAPAPGSLLSRAAQGLRAGGLTAGFLSSLSERLKNSSLPEAAAGSGAQTATSARCATKAAGFAASRTPPPVTPHSAAIKAVGVAGASAAGAIVCSPIAKPIGDLAENSVEGIIDLPGNIMDSFESLSRIP